MEQGALNAKPQLMLAISTGRKIQAWNSYLMQNGDPGLWIPPPPPPTDGAFRGYSGFVLSVCSDMFDISGDHTVHSGTLKRKLPKSLESVCLTLFHSFYKYRTPPGCQPYSWGQNRQTPLPSWADILWFLYQ